MIDDEDPFKDAHISQILIQVPRQRFCLNPTSYSEFLNCSDGCTFHRWMYRKSKYLNLAGKKGVFVHCPMPGSDLTLTVKHNVIPWLYAIPGSTSLYKQRQQTPCQVYILWSVQTQVTIKALLCKTCDRSWCVFLDIHALNQPTVTLVSSVVAWYATSLTSQSN